MARKTVKPPEITKTVLSSGPILESLRGHEGPRRILGDALIRCRLASTFIFAGPAGIGKHRFAWGLAQSLVCERRDPHGAGACGECGPCIRVAHGQSESVLSIEPQGVAIKIEQAHETLKFLSLRQIGRARIVIFNDAHLMNPQTGNALLKAFEEPPEGTFFFLVSSQPGALLSTIRSRAQMIRFHALTDDEIRELTGAPDWIVRAAQGSMEAASRLGEGADEWSTLRRSALTALHGFVEGREAAALSDEFRERLKDRNSALFVAQIWGRALRDFAFCSAAGRLEPMRANVPDQAEWISRGGRLPTSWLLQLSELCLQFEQDLLRNIDKTLALENFCMAVIQAYSGREPRPVLSS